MDDSPLRRRARPIPFGVSRFITFGGWALLAVNSFALPYNAVQTEYENNAGQRLTLGGNGWADMDNDGDLDIVVSGQDSGGNRQFRVYRNNGPAAYTLNATQIEIFGANQGLQDGGVVLGDLNGDGNVDAVVTGNRGAAATRQILVII
jgi:acylphosphatase